MARTDGFIIRGMSGRVIEVSGILLAAGESRRMGRFKQLLPLAGKTFVERCVDNLLASDISEILVVTGHRSADVRRAIGGRAVRFVHNPDYSEGGMATSVKAGIESLSAKSQAVLIALVDQPRVPSRVIDALIDAYRKERALIIIPTCRGKKGHPVLIDLDLRNEILAMNPETGLRTVVRAHVDRTMSIEVNDDSILDDFDRPEDYARLDPGSAGISPG